MARRLRVAGVDQAPALALERELRRRTVWVRALRSVGLRCTDPDPAPTDLVVGEHLTFRSDRRSPGTTVLEVLSLKDLPEIALSTGQVKVRARLHLAPTAAGVLVTLDLLVDAPTLLFGAVRRRLLTLGENLLGIVAVSCRDVRVVVAGAVLRDGQVLAARRTRPPELAGLWEMPGGKVEEGETEAKALVRELREELAIEVTVGRRIGPAFWVRDDLVLHAYLAPWVAGEPAPAEAEPAHDQVRWLGPGELDQVEWLPGDQPFVAAVAEHLTAI